MSRRKEPEPEPEREATAVSLIVTESVTLALAPLKYGYREAYYHQSATTADLESFIKEAQRKFDSDECEIYITNGGISATKKTFKY